MDLSNWGDEMRPAQLATLKFVTLLFLLPGLAGLVISAWFSTHYLETMPRAVTVERSVPREIHGIVVYQTKQEDKRLSALEYFSVAIFSVGLVLGLVYLEKWQMAQVRYGEDEEDTIEDRY